MEHEDLEGLADAAYVEAGEDPCDARSPVSVARALLGPDSVEIVPPGALRYSTAKLARVGDALRIFLRRGAPETMGFAVAHELAHWLIRREGGGLDDEEEDNADYLGAALVAPRKAFRAALRTIGRDLPELADAFGTTESLVALRYGESTSTPLALIRPGLVRVRSHAEFVWPSETTIIRWASGTPPRGLVKTRLTDDRRRVVLVGDDLADAV